MVKRQTTTPRDQENIHARLTGDEPPADDRRARIEARAYALYLERGCREGYAEQDWLDAEREIVNEAI